MTFGCLAETLLLGFEGYNHSFSKGVLHPSRVEATIAWAETYGFSLGPLTLDDKVVLPAQAEMMVEVLERKGIPYAYLPFEGEGHGFRKEENVVRSLEATLSFVGQVFGFEPADAIEPLVLSVSPA